MFIDRFSREWKAADQYAIDCKKSHSVPESTERWNKKQSLKICQSWWRWKIGTAKYFKGTFFDYWRFWNEKNRVGLKRNCANCEIVFRPKKTPEQIYESYMKRRNAYVNYYN